MGDVLPCGRQPHLAGLFLQKLGSRVWGLGLGSEVRGSGFTD